MQDSRNLLTKLFLSRKGGTHPSTPEGAAGRWAWRSFSSWRLRSRGTAPWSSSTAAWSRSSPWGPCRQSEGRTGSAIEYDMYSQDSKPGSAPPVVKIKTSILYPSWKLIFFCSKVTDWQMRNPIWSTQFPGGIQDRSIYFRHGRQHLSHSSFRTKRNEPGMMRGNCCLYAWALAKIKDECFKNRCSLWWNNNILNLWWLEHPVQCVMHSPLVMGICRTISRHYPAKLIN